MRAYECLGLGEAPKSVAILGMGLSIGTYVHLIAQHGSRRSVYDQVWAINAVAAALCADLIFHMDDIRLQERRAGEGRNAHIAGLLTTLSGEDGPPILTSVVHPQYPRCRSYPLEDVLRVVRYPYFNSTAAYAVAFAIALGVERIGLYGCDFSYPNAHRAESGRGCVEFWIGMAMARGIAIQVPNDTTLLDAKVSDRERFYGYDYMDVSIVHDDDGMPSVRMSPRALDAVPDHREIETRYRGPTGRGPGEHA